MAYAERPVPGSGAVLWAAGRSSGTRVLPDGCLDVLWTQDAPYGLMVAGPDRRAWVSGPTGPITGLRLAPGTGPAVLGVPADLLTGLRVPLVELWPAARMRRLADSLHREPDRLMSLVDLTSDADRSPCRSRGCSPREAPSRPQP